MSDRTHDGETPSPVRPAGKSSEPDEERLNDVLETLVALAAGDFERRARVGDGSLLLDGIATGLNMLGEELIRRRAFDETMHARARESERLALVGQLAASVAHEINNPAAFVLANLARLSEGLPREDATPVASRRLTWPEAEALLEDCIAGVERIAAIVGGLKGIARRDVGPPVLVDLTAVVDDAAKMVDRYVRQRARFLVARHPLPAVLGDYGQLVQVFTNLLANAAESIPEDASDRHRVEVRASVDGGSVVVSVHDTGVGIADSDRERIFEAFFSTKPRGVGTGLGLTTSLEIVQAHGGTLDLESVPGRGSTFRVRLPVAVTPNVASSPIPVETSNGTRPGLDRGPDGLPLRLLIVDDEEPLLLAYQRLYGSRYMVTVAVGGRQAQEIVERDQAWDAILCDLMMPECDGPEFCRWLEARFPETARRLILCSGGVFTSRASAFLAQFDGPLLNKPFRRAELVDALAGLPRRVLGGDPVG